MKKPAVLSAVALATAAMLATSAAEARSRYVAPVVAAGIIGGLAVGAAVAAAHRPVTRVTVVERRVRSTRVVPVYTTTTVRYTCGNAFHVYAC